MRICSRSTHQPAAEVDAKVADTRLLCADIIRRDS